MSSGDNRFSAIKLMSDPVRRLALKMASLMISVQNTLSYMGIKEDDRSHNRWDGTQTAYFPTPESLGRSSSVGSISFFSFEKKF